LNERDYKKERQWMIAKQLKPRGINDQKVLKAMKTVPRHLFVPEGYRDYAYDDGPIPIDKEQTISQPYIVALMAQELKLDEGKKVLEIGTGSGYAAAVLSHIAGQVFTVERHPELAEKARQCFAKLDYDNISCRTADGTEGWKEKGPFDGIMVSAAAPVIPEALIEQLAMGGRIIIPIGDWGGIQKLLRATRKTENRLESEELDYVRFVPLIRD